MTPALVLLLISIIENAPGIARGIIDAVGVIKLAIYGGADLTPAQIAAVADNALSAGASLDAVVIARMSPGGDWAGRTDIPADVVAAFKAAVATAKSRTT